MKRASTRLDGDGFIQLAESLAEQPSVHVYGSERRVNLQPDVNRGALESRPLLRLRRPN
jgi:hypothetical protein